MQYLQEAFLKEHGVLCWMGWGRVGLIGPDYDRSGLRKELN